MKEWESESKEEKKKGKVKAKVKYKIKWTEYTVGPASLFANAPSLSVF